MQTGTPCPCGSTVWVETFSSSVYSLKELANKDKLCLLILFQKLFCCGFIFTFYYLPFHSIFHRFYFHFPVPFPCLGLRSGLLGKLNVFLYQLFRAVTNFSLISQSAVYQPPPITPFYYSEHTKMIYYVYPHRNVPGNDSEPVIRIIARNGNPEIFILTSALRQEFLRELFWNPK